MRAKQYFWNKKHHRELDVRMGLVGRMAEPFAQLAEACGINSATGGTKGLTPIFTFLVLDKNPTAKMSVAGYVPYNFEGNSIPDRFLRTKLSAN